MSEKPAKRARLIPARFKDATIAAVKNQLVNKLKRKVQLKPSHLAPTVPVAQPLVGLAQPPASMAAPIMAAPVAAPSVASTNSTLLARVQLAELKTALRKSKAAEKKSAKHELQALVFKQAQDALAAVGQADLGHLDNDGIIAYARKHCQAPSILGRKRKVRNPLSNLKRIFAGISAQQSCIPSTDGSAVLAPQEKSPESPEMAEKELAVRPPEPAAVSAESYDVTEQVVAENPKQDADIAPLPSKEITTFPQSAKNADAKKFWAKFSSPPPAKQKPSATPVTPPVSALQSAILSPASSAPTAAASSPSASVSPVTHHSMGTQTHDPSYFLVSSTDHATGKQIIPPKTPSLVAERIRENPSQCLVVSASLELYCNACKEVLATKNATVSDHVKSAKHTSNTRAQLQATSESKDIAHLMLTSTNQTVKNAEWRTQVVMAMAESGIPLHKLEIEGVPSRLHRILSHGGSLGNRGNLADIYPVLLRRELELIHQEVQEGAAEFNSGAVLLGATFDGSTKVCERYAVLLRFIGKNGQICYRLIALPALQASLNAQQLFSQIVLSLTGVNLKLEMLISASADRASVNLDAQRQIKMCSKNFLTAPCLSHLLDGCGKRFGYVDVVTFFKSFHNLSRSTQAKLKFSDQFGVAPKGFSDTRWWSVLVQGVQLFVYYDGLEEYFTWLVVNDIAKESAQVCLEYVHLGFPPFVLSFCRSLHVSFRFLSFWFIRSLFLVFQLNQHLGVYRLCRNTLFKAQLAAFCDFGEHFAAATYLLEGDNWEIIKAWFVVQDLLTLATRWSVPGSNVHPRLTALARAQEIRAGAAGIAVGLKTLLEKAGQDGIQPALDYLNHIVTTDTEVKQFLDVCHIASLFDPKQAAKFPLGLLVGKLASVPFLTAQERTDFASAVPAYLAHLGSLPANFFDEFDKEGHDLLAWFWHIRGTYSAISRVAMLCALVSASSASAERMFSYLKTMFPDQRDSALEDIVATSVMYRANFNYRNNEDKRCNRRK